MYSDNFRSKEAPSSDPTTMILSKTKHLVNSKNAEGLLYYITRNQVLHRSNVAATQTLKTKLPSLPVPKLNQTLEKYLKTVEPFLNESELNHTKKLLQQFQSENGIGTKLQQLLLDRAESSDNWLSDWWLSAAYLEYRDPVVVFSSPGLVFPFEHFRNEQERLNYTAKLIIAALDYKSLIDSGKMPLDMMGKDPLDMNQYNKIFGTCRIPGVKRDHLEYNPQSKHIVVAMNNNFFKLEVVNNLGKIPSVSQLVSLLEEIAEESQEIGPEIGVLTAENRNAWGKVYQDLILDPTNLKSIREIQTSLFLVCLDNPMPNRDENVRSEASKQLIHGGGSPGNAANRWYDKTVQFVISKGGAVGLTYEHSPSEGQPIAVMTDFLVDHIKNDTSIHYPDVRFDGEAEKLPFNINEKALSAIENAKRSVDKLAANLELDAFQYSSYGKEFIKSHKMSPDSYIQIAMQYAFYRIHKVAGAHYESAATRKYLHGRTETIRSCSNESVNFAKAMLDSSKSDSEKASALREAINAHKKYSIEAVNGFGVDRHLLGLKLAALEHGIEIPEFYKDPSFVRSTHMRISTSQVATKCDGFMCYGPLVADGYGCCYNPRANDINFAVSAFVEHPETAAAQFRKALTASLDEMFSVLVKTQKSKL